MKKMFFISAAVAVLLLVSCKKTYTCVCTHTNLKSDSLITTTSAPVEAKNKSEAVSMCNFNSKDGFFYATGYSRPDTVEVNCALQ